MSFISRTEEVKTDKTAASTLDQPTTESNTPALEQQYGGGHVGRWVDSLPPSWIPFIQLARLSPPVGILMAYFPNFFGTLLGGIAAQAPWTTILRSNVILLVYSFFGSNTGHALNDLVDEGFDRAVTRTLKRPIPRGAISRHAALVFAASQVIGVMAVVGLFLPRANIWYVLLNMTAVAYYPFAKRHTYFTQLVLGFCLAWGVFMGSVSVGHEPFAWEPLEPHVHNGVYQSKALYTTFGPAQVDLGVVSFFLAVICWMTISDTVYAHQDLKDDLALGLKSMAVLLQERTKAILGVFLVGMVSLLMYCGVYYGFGTVYFLVTPVVSFGILAAMLVNVDLKDSGTCWWWFQNAFWGMVWSISVGLLLEYTTIYLSLTPSGR